MKKLPITPYIGSVLMLIFCVVLYHQSNDHRRNQNTQAAVMGSFTNTAFPLPDLPTQQLPEGVATMEGERLAFFGPQLNAEQMTSFLAAYRIDHVVDLAHEAKAERILPGDTERFIVEKTGAQYWAFNIEGRNNRLNQRHLAVIDSLLDSGKPVFVHCLHGIHRAGVVKGRAYARDLRRWQEIVDLLGWKEVVTNSKYDRYTNDVWEQVQRFNYPVNRTK